MTGVFYKPFENEKPPGVRYGHRKKTAAARRNIKKAAAAAKKKRTVAHLSKKTRTTLGKEGAYGSAAFRKCHNVI